MAIGAKYLGFAGVGLAVLALDQLGKRHVEAALAVGERVPILGSLLALAHEPATGGALGLIRDSSPAVQLAIYGGLAGVALVITVVFLRALAPRELATGSALGAILGGIGSNVLDRWRSGATIDFLHLGPTASNVLPDFNLADLAIVLGVGTLIIELLASEMAARAAERPRRSPPV